MLSLMEPSEQLLAALLVGGATVSAAIVNATAQVKVAREARKNSKPAPPPSKRMMRWLMVGGAVALGLGWSATSDRLEGSSGRPGFMGAGVTSMLGASADDDDRSLIVAALHLVQPVTEEQALELLHAYNLSPYAIDVRLTGEPEAWLPVPTGRQPAITLPRARADAVRRAWQQTCALESVMVGANATSARVAHDSLSTSATAQADMAGDSAAFHAVRGEAGHARRRAEQLAEQPAVIHAIRVLATASAATRAAQDTAVARAEIVRFDPGWPTQEPAPISEGCEVVQLAAN